MDSELSKDMFKKIEMRPTFFFQKWCYQQIVFLADNRTKSLKSGLHVVLLDNNMNWAAEYYLQDATHSSS